MKQNRIKSKKDTYEVIHKIGFNKLKNFYADEIAHKHYTYCIVAAEGKINPKK